MILVDKKNTHKLPQPLGIDLSVWSPRNVSANRKWKLKFTFFDSNLSYWVIFATISVLL